jgi:hypothetical protein
VVLKRLKECEQQIERELGTWSTQVPILKASSRHASFWQSISGISSSIQSARMACDDNQVHGKRTFRGEQAAARTGGAGARHAPRVGSSSSFPWWREVSPRILSENQAELLIGVHGLIDTVYWRELGAKTHRGMQGRALRGLATGGRCFGYKTSVMHDGTRSLELQPAEAGIIRKIFELYRTGHSLKRIAWHLNETGVKSPQPQKGRLSRSWCTSSVRTILRNERYLGKLMWYKTRKVRVPGTGKRVYRPRPTSEWVITEAPRLHVVSDELWAAVQNRFKLVRVCGSGKERATA